jgi:hypothetical protein
MSRRAIKKMLRRAEEAIRDERFDDAEIIYRRMLDAFSITTPSLLDHAGAIWGLVQTLHYKNQTERAIQLADEARNIIAAREQLVAAA